MLDAVRVNRKQGVTYALAATMVLTSAAMVWAGTGGSEFSTIYAQLQEWFQGNLGKTIALTGLGVGLGMGVVRQSVMAVVLGVSMGLGVYYGPTIIDSVVLAVL